MVKYETSIEAKRKYVKREWTVNCKYSEFDDIELGVFMPKLKRAHLLPMKKALCHLEEEEMYHDFCVIINGENVMYAVYKDAEADDDLVNVITIEVVEKVSAKTQSTTSKATQSTTATEQLVSESSQTQQQQVKPPVSDETAKKVAAEEDDDGCVIV